MGCERMRGCIEDYAAGKLPAGEAAALEAHLKDCAACGRELRWVRVLKAGISAGPRPALPPELRESLMRMAREFSLSRSGERLPGKDGVPWLAAWRAAAGLGLATACAAALLVFGRPGAEGEALSLDEALAAHSRYELTMPAADREAVFADLGLRLSREGERHD
ncbi:MAG: zf-HC2 domain-containing protein [Elusimicrobia bacterium]|nr:zf-HC2 domain-containing protein [Elusimicrobiota bacterium]